MEHHLMPRHKLTPQERQTVLDAVDAAIAHGATIAEGTGSLKKGAAAVADRITALREQAIADGVPQPAIDAYLDELNLTPKQIKTAIELMNGAPLPDSFTIRLRADRNRFPEELDPDAPRRSHFSGAIRPGEPLVIGRRGERLLSWREWRRLRKQRGKEQP